MFKFLKLLARNLMQGPSTDAFPYKEAYTPERFRGRVTVTAERCVGCKICHHVCAGQAIRVEDNEDKTGYVLSIWHNSCALCGMCRHFCPTKAITLSTNWHNAHVQEEKYAFASHYDIPYLACAGCGAPIRMLPPHVATRIYAHSPINMTELMKLCPDCRQLATAQREGLIHDQATEQK